MYKPGCFRDVFIDTFLTTLGVSLGFDILETVSNFKDYEDFLLLLAYPALDFSVIKYEINELKSILTKYCLKRSIIERDASDNVKTIIIRDER